MARFLLLLEVKRANRRLRSGEMRVVLKGGRVGSFERPAKNFAREYYTRPEGNANPSGRV
jgi:hypothetical protein